MRLPDKQDIQRQAPQAPATTIEGIANTSSIGGAVSNVGAALGQAADRRANFDQARAKADFLRRKTVLEGEFGNDRDWETMPGRYEDAIRKGLNESAQMIRDERSRALFMEQAQVSIEEGMNARRADAFLIERDEARAGVNENLNELNESALVGDLEEAYATVGALLEGAVEAGYYGAEEAGKVERAWKDTFASSKIALMPPRQRVDALSQPWAQNIPVETRAKLLEDARKDQIEEDAIDLVDEMIASGMDMTASNKALRSIEDKELRKEAERRRDYVFRQRETAKVERQDQVFEGYGMKVLMGESMVSDIPRDQLDFLDVSQVEALKRAEASRLKGETVTTDREVVAEFYELYTQGKYEMARNLLYDNSDRFADADFKSLLSKAAKPDENSDPFAIESARTLTQSIDQVLDGAGLNSKKHKGEMLLKYDGLYQQYQRSTGKEPDDEWRDKTLNDLAVKMYIDRDGAPFNDVKMQRFRIDEIEGIPREHVQSVLLGVDPDGKKEIPETRIQAAYISAIQRYAAAGVEDPTPEEITKGVRFVLKEAQGE